MEIITEKEALKYGISAVHHIMENDEKRFRLVSEAGSSYVLTMTSDKPSWQRSHYHVQKKEFYVVEKGSVLLALWSRKDSLKILKLNENDWYFVPEGVAHNLYTSPESVFHTIKYGTEDDDWNACPELEELLKKVNVSEYL